MSKLTDTIILLHESAHPHVARRVQDQLNAMLWDGLKHPDLLSCDFYIFGPLKKVLKFNSDDSLQEVVIQCFGQQCKKLFAEGMCQLVHQWGSCLNGWVDFYNCCNVSILKQISIVVPILLQISM